MLSEQQQRIMGYFIEEAKDHLNTIEQGLVSLQATIQDSEMVHEVFRAAHSVKGGAAMLGLDSIQKTAHRLEDYFKVLKECPQVQVDQRLETLFLRVYDALQELVDQLQGPFGLTDDKAQEVMAGAEPVFSELNQHLIGLVNQAGGAPPEDVDLAPLSPVPVVVAAAVPSNQAEASALRFIFQTDVPARLREMLQLFKQADTAESRAQLQELCRVLAQPGEQLALPQWCALLQQAQRAIATPENAFRTLAPIIIKDVKRAQEQVLAGHTADICACDDLLALIPAAELEIASSPDRSVTPAAMVPVEVELPAAEEAMTEAGLSGSLEAIAPADVGDEETLTDTFEFDLAPATTLQEEDPLPVDLSAAADETDLNADLGAVNGATDIDSFFDFDLDMAPSSPSTLDSSSLEASDLSGMDLIDALDESVSSTEIGDQTGPEVGIAELNSLADLFEGELPDLGLVWQEETGSSISEEPSLWPEMDNSNDFSDLLFEPDGLEAELILSDGDEDDLSGLLNAVMLPNHHKNGATADPLPDPSSAETFVEPDLLFGDDEPIEQDSSNDMAMFFDDEFLSDSSLDDRPATANSGSDDQSGLQDLDDLFGSVDLEAAAEEPLSLDPSLPAASDRPFSAQDSLREAAENRSAPGAINPVDAFGTFVQDEEVKAGNLDLFDLSEADLSEAALDLSDAAAPSEFDLPTSDLPISDLPISDDQIEAHPLEAQTLDSQTEDQSTDLDFLLESLPSDEASLTDPLADDIAGDADLMDLFAVSEPADRPALSAEITDEALGFDLTPPPEAIPSSDDHLFTAAIAHSLDSEVDLGLDESLSADLADLFNIGTEEEDTVSTTDLLFGDADLDDLATGDSSLDLPDLQLPLTAALDCAPTPDEAPYRSEAMNGAASLWREDGLGGDPADSEADSATDIETDSEITTDMALGFDREAIAIDYPDMGDIALEMDQLLDGNSDPFGSAGADESWVDSDGIDGEASLFDFEQQPELDAISTHPVPPGIAVEADELSELDALLEADEETTAPITAASAHRMDIAPVTTAPVTTTPVNTTPAQEVDDSLDEFSDLELLLEDSPMEDSPSVTHSSVSVNTTNHEPNDAFSDLDALLEDELPPSMPPQPTTGVNEDEPEDEFGDLEALLQDADQKLGGGTSSGRSTSAATNRRSPRRGAISDQTMRVSVKHLDNLNNLVGEMVVNRNSLEQSQERLRQFLDNLVYQVQQLNDVGQRMRDLYERSLLESSLLSSRRSYHLSGTSGFASTQTSHATGMSFDALEMDRFTGFHTLSQEMIELIVRVRESASDIDFIVEESDQVTRNFRQITTQLQEGLTRSRMVPFAHMADRLPRGVRDNAIKYGKQAELVIEGRDTQIDKMIVEQLYDPMTHLVNNAIAHGIEPPEERIAAGKPPTGRIVIRTFHQGNQTVISVSDDGAGIDPERVKMKALAKGLIKAADVPHMARLDIYDLLFHHGFSTADQVDDLRGRGVGLDVVRSNLNEIRGSISIDSTIGKGTTFTIRLPLTLSISKALCCISNRARIAFPMDGVEDMLDVPNDRVQMDAENRPCIQWRDSLLPFQPLADLLKYNRMLGRGSVYGGNQEEDILSIVVLRSAGNFLALQVDQVLGEQEIVIKQLEGPVPKPVGVAGATVLGDGRIMPIADVLELIDLSQGRIRREVGSALWEIEELPPEATITKTEPTVLIVDDSITVRELLSMTFNKVGYRVEQARDGQEAWEKLRSGLPCDLVFCDIEMPRMDGLELLSRIQKDPALNHLPIAMLTSRGADRHRQMAVQLGAKGYFTKPYLEEMLLDAAQRMLKGEVLVAASA